MARSGGSDGDERWSMLPEEKPAAKRRRLNSAAKDGKVVRAVDRSGLPGHLEHSAKKLRAVRAEARILHVPQWDMAKAKAAMERAGVSGSVANLCGSRKIKVRRRK